MSVSLSFLAQATVLEDLTTADDLSSAQLTHSEFNRKFTKKNTDATTPCDTNYSKTLTGTQTLDLTALPTINGDVDCTGKKLRAILVTNDSGNTGVLQVGPGAANPYPLFGTGITVDVQLDGTLLLWFGDGLAAVAAGVKTIKFTPADAGDSYNVQLVLG